MSGLRDVWYSSSASDLLCKLKSKITCATLRYSTYWVKRRAFNKICSFIIIIIFLECHNKLGMASGDIKDEQISASMFDGTYKPEQARFRGNSAWCVAARNGSGAFLEVDLGEIKKVTWLGIQGFGDGYVSNFTIQYKRRKVDKYWRSFVERLPFNTSNIVVGLRFSTNFTI